MFIAIQCIKAVVCSVQISADFSVQRLPDFPDWMLGTFLSAKRDNDFPYSMDIFILYLQEVRSIFI